MFGLENSGPSGEAIALIFLVWIVLPLLVSFGLGMISGYYLGKRKVK